MKVYSDYEGNGIVEDELVNVSSVLRIQNLEIALEKAIGEISLLQENLSFVIKIKEEL